jgi:hypothetical protein
MIITTKTFIPKTAEELKKCEASLSEVDIKKYSQWKCFSY